MKVFIALCLALVTIVTAKPNGCTTIKHQAEFDQWKIDYGKTYESDLHELSRQAIWESNLQYVNEVNGRGGSLKLEMNEFGDMESSEFVSIYNGLLSRSHDYNNTNIHRNNAIPAGQSKDWRTEGAVTPVKNQGRCGSCWSFSATGSLEGQYKLKLGQLYSLSEQQIIDCSTKFGNHGCKGGLMDLAFEYLASIAGDEQEEDYRYKAEDGLCKYESSLAVVGTKSHTDIPKGGISELLNAVSTVGPISVAMDASHKSFQLYREGIYSERECSSTKLDHGVLIVGYGTESGVDYWLVKNSWGTAWGMEGYFKIGRSNNQCGLATQASYPGKVVKA